MSNLTVCYLTNRRNPMIHWALDAIDNQGGRNLPWIVVDFYKEERFLSDPVWGKVNQKGKHISPMPNVWCGPSRRTRENWFSAAIFRNSGLCHCATPFILYLDDLSLPMPAFVENAKDAACHPNRVTLGSYRKVKNMEVVNGTLKSFEDFPNGHDNRLRYGSKPRKEHGGHLYGCNLVAPVEHLLRIDGWPQSLCAGIGFEDCVAGTVLGRAGSEFWFNPQMQTYESEELHHVDKPFRKEDWHMENGVPVVGGNGHNDMSHDVLNIARNSDRFDNGFGAGGIRAVRERILNGGEWEVPLTPEHHWWTKIPLKDL